MELTKWCPKCREHAVPMRNGTCGFCDSPLTDPPPDAPPLHPQDPDDEDPPVSADDEDEERSLEDALLAAAGEVPAEEDWPHTAGVARRQVVDDEAPAGRAKRQGLGARARGPMLATPVIDDDDDDEPVEPADASHNPSRSPILDWLVVNGPDSATAIAGELGRKPGNVSSRLRQLESAGFVRRTGKTIPGGRGGPMIEWEIMPDDGTQTSPTDVLDSPLTVPPVDVDLKVRYFDALLAKVDRDEDCPEHIFQRIERIVGL